MNNTENSDVKLPLLSDKNGVDQVSKPEQAWTPRKPRQLTRKQKAFADHLLANPKASATESASLAYNVSTRHTAEVIASENLSKPEIIKYLELHGDKALQDMIDIAQYAKEYGRYGGRDGASYATVAVQANKDIADRAFGKATTRVEVTSRSVSVNIDLTGTVQ